MEYKEIIEIFKGAAANPGGQAGQWKKEHEGKIFGFLLTDVPEELVHAAGFLPYAVNAEEGMLDFADAHLQTWACSFSRNSLAAAVQGKLSFLDGLIIPQTCDTTRMLMGIWKHVRPLSFMENYRLPRQVDRPSAGDYLHGELKRLKERLEDFRGREIKEDELTESISLYNRNRRLLRRLYMVQVKTPQLLSSKDLFTIIKASMVMPREKVNFLLEQLLAACEAVTGSDHKVERRRLLISGTLLEPLELLDFINEKGGLIVADDLQNGSRYLEADAAENGDPLEALVQRQLKRMPSALYEPQKQRRAKYLVNLAREKGAQGVLFLHLKFCEPENYDYYDNMQAMEKAGIPAMRVETAFGGIPPGQLQTRVHAFMEMLGGEDVD
ncbi:MAG: 2-hydroxyacyl-CoA dehydratase family protein [Bacillota bacterium]